MSNLIVKENFLSLELIKNIKNYVYGQKTHSSNFVRWGQGIVRSSSAVMVFDLPDTYTSEIKNVVLEKFGLTQVKDFGVMYYAWTKLSYIPWHYDSHVNSGITIYLNEFWHKDWGGYFAYENDEKIECIKPSFNKAIQVIMPTHHTVFNTTIDAPVRETIQIFIEKESSK